MQTTEWVTECVDEDGDITECEYWPTEREALAYAARLLKDGETVRLAKVTNTWDRRDPDNLLDRTYDYR